MPSTETRTVSGNTDLHGRDSTGTKLARNATVIVTIPRMTGRVGKKVGAARRAYDCTTLMLAADGASVISCSAEPGSSEPCSIDLRAAGDGAEEESGFESILQAQHTEFRRFISGRRPVSKLCRIALF